MSAGKDGGSMELLGLGTWTKQGPATLVTRGGAWVVLVPGLRKQVVEAAWDLLGQRVVPEEFLDRLLAAGGIENLDKVPALLFGVHDGTTATFGVKGSTPIAVHTAEGVQQIVGTEEEPFVLTTLEGVRRTAFGELPNEESIGTPRVESGIVAVRGFVHVSVDPESLDAATRSALAEQVEREGRSIETAEARTRRAERPAPTPREAPTPSATPLRKPALATRKPGEMPPSISRGTSSSRAAEPEPEPSGPNLFSGLFADAPSSPPGADGTATVVPAAPARPVAAERTAPAPPRADRGSDGSGPAPAPAAVPDPTSTAGPPPMPGPEPTGNDVAAPASGTGEQRSPAPARRRLVSTSLFDRRRPSSHRQNPAATSMEDPSIARGSTATVAPVPGTPASAPEPVTTPAVPTPAPLEEELESPVTQVAPVDEDELESPVTQVAPVDEDPAPRHVDAPARRPAPVSDLENSGAYDDLFGKTVFRRIEDAAVRRAGDEDEEADLDGPSAAPPERAAPEETVAGAPDAGQSAASNEPSLPAEQPASPVAEFIDWVPGVGRAAPEIARTAARRAAEPPPAQPTYPQVHLAERPPAPQVDARGGHGVAASTDAGDRRSGAPASPAGPRDATGPVSRHLSIGGGESTDQDEGPPRQQGPAQGRQSPMPRRHAGAPHPVAPTGPARPDGPGTRPPSTSAASPQAPGPGGVVTIPGMVCWNGHANSPERQLCRVCGAPLQGETRTVARPPLGSIEISTGERFVLDRTAIIGRRPRASRVSADHVPRLITVPSPQQDISRSHLELRLEGWHVVALDLGTTNGTTLHRAGYDPARLRPRDGVVLHHGDQLDLGDGVHLRFGERE